MAASATGSRLDAETLIDLMTRIWTAAGLPPEDPRPEAEVLAWANLRGVDLRDANLYDTNLYGTDLCRAQLDVNIRDSRSFRDAKFTSDALPWLILHPEWSKLKDTVRIKVMEKEKEKVVCSVQIDPI